MADVDGRRQFRGEGLGGDAGQLLGPDAEDQLGQQVGELLLHRHGTREAQRLRGHPPGEDLRHFLVRLVLQQPGEQQVPGLQQGQVLLVLDLARRQQPGRLEVEQGGRHQQEVAGLVEVPLGPLGPDVGDELVGDLGERDLGDVELVFGDEAEEQIERALEDVQVDLEASRCALLFGHLAIVAGAGQRESTSRASSR